MTGFSHTLEPYRVESTPKTSTATNETTSTNVSEVNSLLSYFFLFFSCTLFLSFRVLSHFLCCFADFEAFFFITFLVHAEHIRLCSFKKKFFWNYFIDSIKQALFVSVEFVKKKKEFQKNKKYFVFYFTNKNWLTNRRLPFLFVCPSKYNKVSFLFLFFFFFLSTQN